MIESKIKWVQINKFKLNKILLKYKENNKKKVKKKSKKKIINLVTDENNRMPTNNNNNVCVGSSGECTSYVLRIAVKARSRALGPIHPSFNLVMYLRDGLYDFLPDNAHELASGRLFISLTRVSDRKNVLISQFDTKDDLIQVRVRTRDPGAKNKKIKLYFLFLGCPGG